jgi:phytoene desaturase
VVVGAGLAGLSCALHLLGSGRRVTLLESSPAPGGRAGRMTLDGYTFDSGASVLTMPELIEEALGAVGASMPPMVQLDPAYRAHFPDGSTIRVFSSAEAMEQEVRQVAGPAEADGYRRLRAWLTELYRVERDSFIGANFDSPLDLVSARLASLIALGGFGKLGPAIGKHLSDHRLRRLFSFQSLYAGVPPRQALAAYAVIAYMDTIAGVWFPRGGVASVAASMASAASAAGADVRYSCRAVWLERVGSRVNAVRTSTGERIACDAVVLTPDLPIARQLLGLPSRRLVPLQWSPSAVVLHAGVDRSWPSLGHHTIFFGGAWDRTFDEITRQGKLMSDPSLLVTRPTATEPSLAPDGREVVQILAPCPNLRGSRIDWPRVGPAYRDELVGVLEKRGLTGLGSSIKVSQLVTPADWEAQGLGAGTPFSLAHTFRQTGPFRPRNLVSGVENAVLAGCGTTPGVGIPPVVISGKLAAERITG